MKNKKLLLIYNPIAGSGKFKGRLDFIISELQERNIMLTLYRTKGKGLDDFSSVIEQADSDGILVAGGDGSLHQVISAMLGKKIKLPIGILGGGTSNDFASHLGLEGELGAYFDRIAKGITRWVDASRANDRFFLNVASAGVLTGVAHEVPQVFKNILGKLAYYAKSLEKIPKLRSFGLKITADDKLYELDSFLFVVANSPVVAGMACIGEGIAIDDGRLDLLAIKKSSLPQFLAAATDLIAGKGINNRENVLHVQAKKFFIEADTDLLSDLDGELGPKLPLAIEVLPKAVEVYV